MNYDNFCKQVLDIDSKIRFAAICDMSGEIAYDIQRPGVKNLLTREETELSISQAVLRWSTRKSIESKIGKAKYAMAEYEKIKRITLPIDDNHILFISTEVTADVKKIVDDIADLIARSK